jgi:hypothetical protein
MCGLVDAMYRTRGDKTGSVSIVTGKLAALYWQFLDNNFKEYLLVCSPSVYNTEDLKKVTSSTSSNT